MVCEGESRPSIGGLFSATKLSSEVRPKSGKNRLCCPLSGERRGAGALQEVRAGESGVGNPLRTRIVSSAARWCGTWNLRSLRTYQALKPAA